MPFAQYRIEASSPLPSRLLPTSSTKTLYSNSSLAVAVAVKSLDDPTRQQVRVVYVPTGEIIFQTAAIADPAP